MLLISNLIFAYNYYKRHKRRKKGFRAREHYNVTTATSKANYHTIQSLKISIENLTNRVDFMQVHLDRCLHWITEKPSTKESKDVLPIKPSNPVKQSKPVSEEFKSNIVNVLKPKGKKKPVRKLKSSKLFTDKQIDTELRKELGEILFLKPSEYKKEFEKAYKRLYYKHITKKNK